MIRVIRLCLGMCFIAGVLTGWALGGGLSFEVMAGAFVFSGVALVSAGILVDQYIGKEQRNDD